ncbi:MAG: hypothetical protein ACRCX7_11415 [Cetobacterium sp.]|uniref:hypothetical protein n=1 Tax=Cetobacterium sp. TaxID=2071632 RepID=UPI003F336EC3
MRRVKYVSTLDEYLEEHLSIKNDLIRNKYIAELKGNSERKLRKTREELIMAIKAIIENKATTSGGKRTGAGRKKREITEEMISDLTVLAMEAYCEKYKCGEMFFLNLYYKNVGMKKEEVVIEKFTTIEKEVEVDIFGGLLTDTDILYGRGYIEWAGLTQKKCDGMEEQMQDVMHAIQLKDVTQPEKIALFDMLRDIRIERAKYKDSIMFAMDNSDKIISLLELKKTVRDKKRALADRRYRVKSLVKEFGKTIKEEKKDEKN